MKKTILLGGIFLLLAGASCTQLPAQERMQEEEKTAEPEVVDLVYVHEESGFTLDLPESWVGKYEVVEELAGDSTPNIILKYKPVEDEYDAMLSIYTLYGGHRDVNELFHQPNTKLVLQNKDYIVTMAQPLDMPYMPDTADHDIYAGMTGDIFTVAENASFENGIYTRVKNIMEHKIDEGFVVEVMYPEIGRVENVVDMNEQIESEAQTLVQAFKDNILEWDNTGAPEEAYSSIYLNFIPKMLTEDKISIYYNLSEYFAGAAHPMNGVAGFNYDLKENREVELDDFFEVGQDEYLEPLANLIIEKLEAQFGKMDIDPETMFDSGLEPKIENFSNFNLVEDGLVFNFSQGVIGPNALGSFAVPVRYDELKDIIKIPQI